MYLGEFPVDEYKSAITRFNFSNNNQINFPLKRLRSIDDQTNNKCKCCKYHLVFLISFFKNLIFIFSSFFLIDS